MSNHEKYVRVIEALMSHKNCTFSEANDFLDQYDVINVARAYEDGRYDALHDVAVEMRAWFIDAKEQAGYGKSPINGPLKEPFGPK